MRNRNDNSSKPGFVLITGASSGIGRELSVVFASKGYGLILVSRKRDRLERLAEELHKDYVTMVYTFEVDLSSASSAVMLFHEVKRLDLKVDILVNNAGAGCCGMFHEMEMERIIEMLRLDVESLTCLARLFGEEMVKRGSGRILNVASTGAYQPGPYIAVYYAAKAYVLSLSQAMAEELYDKGVVVSALCPGATRTEFSKAAGKADISSAMEPADVAKMAYKALMKGKRVIIPGTGNKLSILFSKLVPGSWSAVIVKKIQKEMIDKFLTIL